jgi:DNA-binding MarR family transcriptional regulator
MGAREGLSALDLLILRSIPLANNVEDLAKLVKVRPANLGMQIARLQLSGYISEDGELAQKGMDAIAEPRTGDET